MARTNKQRAAVDSAVLSIISGGQQAQAKVKRVKPLSVLLTRDEVKQLDLAAADLGFARHALMQYAVRQFLAEYSRGKKPKIVTRAVKTLKAE